MLSSSASSDVSVSGQSSRHIPLTEVPHLPGTLRVDMRTGPKLGTRAFSASISAPNLPSDGSTHIPCSSVTKCDLNRAPLPQLLVPSQHCHSCPKPSPEASPTTGHRQNDSFQERYPVWPSFCCQVSWCVLLLVQPKSGRNTGPARKAIEFIIVTEYTHSLEISVFSPDQKRLKCTHSLKFEIHLFLVLIIAELKIAPVPQEKSWLGGGHFLSLPTIPCIYTSFSFTKFILPTLALWEMTSMSKRTFCDDGNVTYVMATEHSKCDAKTLKLLLK